MGNVDQFLTYARGAESWVRYEFELQPADAADIVQEVLMRLTRTSRSIQNPKAYLYKACARAAWKYQQRRFKKWRLVPLEVAEVVPAPSVPDWAESNNPRLSKLSKRKWQIVHLLASGFSQAQAAKELSLTPGTVRAYVHEMRRLCRAEAA